MKPIALPLLLLLLVRPMVNAQSTGTINYEYLGIQFTIPHDWVGQEVEGGYLIGSNTKPGFAFLSTIEARSLDEIRVLARQGFMLDGTYLQLHSQLEDIGENMLGGTFTGTLQGTQVTSYMIGVLNPHGTSVLVLAATSPEMYSETHRQLAIDLTESLVFSEPKTAPVYEQWKQKFSDAKLTYMDTYYSNDVGGSGGYNIKREIHLCAQGYFKYSGSSNMSVDTGGAFGNTFGSDGGDGTWTIAGDYQGQPILRLNFNNGEVQEYSLSYEDNKTMLNGERYFVTYANEGAEYAPDCF